MTTTGDSSGRSAPALETVGEPLQQFLKGSAPVQVSEGGILLLLLCYESEPIEDAFWNTLWILNDELLH